MENKFFGKPMSGKRAYYEFGKYISERAGKNTVDDILEDLEVELKRTSFTAPQKSQASKLRKVYEVYVEDFRFSIDELETVSAFDLYKAQTPAFNIVRTKADAVTLVNRLNSGEDFNHICKEYNLAPKTAPEYVIEKVVTYIAGVNNWGSLDEVQALATKYRDLVKAERGNPAKADELFFEYNKVIINLIAHISSEHE